MKYLSGQYLLDPAPGDAGFHFVIPAILFFLLMGMVGTTYCYVVSETNNKRAPLTRMAQRVQTIGWILAFVGLVLIGMRWGGAQIPVVRSRLVLYLAGLGFVALAVYVAWFLVRVLPAKNAAYQQTLLRRQYQPRSRRRR